MCSLIVSGATQPSLSSLLPSRLEQIATWKRKTCLATPVSIFSFFFSFPGMYCQQVRWFFMCSITTWAPCSSLNSQWKISKWPVLNFIWRKKGRTDWFSVPGGFLSTYKWKYNEYCFCESVCNTEWEVFDLYHPSSKLDYSFSKVFRHFLKTLN